MTIPLISVHAKIHGPKFSLHCLRPGIFFSVTVRFDNCIERQAAGYAFELIRDFKADIIVGPTCNIPSISVGAITAYYNLPVYTWGFTTANELADTIRFPTCVVLTPNYLTLSLALLAVMDHFSWDAFAFIYSASEDAQKCPIFLADVQVSL
ncbi:unnamed protein product [Cylicostephanus goldi]|uniref:Receptor ligand binding region domain-containing protein n=1 Tax=Cylicostephanus goldi TaxID=71465 RepID=A0A3P7QE61_CYLGO|nr:unnamed protein product [Cylicostephanus goldi]